MKSSDSTEMERLLRRYARRKGETLPAALNARSDDEETKPASGSHLDADEMNAYAENALPEAARSRYFAHLADCDSCRKLVTELSLAAVVSNEGKARVAALEIKPPTSWRTWLAAIFSPSVLRYGVPALALFAVLVVVAIVAMRSQRNASSVAQNKDESGYTQRAAAPATDSATENTTTTATAESHANSNAATIVEPQIEPQRGVVGGAPTPAKDGPAEGETVREAAPMVSQETVTRSTAEQATDLKDRAIDFGVGGKREQADVAPAPPAARPNPVPSAPAANEPADRERREEAKIAKTPGRDEFDELPVNGRAASGAGANKQRAKEDRNDVGGTAAATTARSETQARRRPLATKSAPSNTAADRVSNQPASETQNVGGRRFQRQGNAWVDTSYNYSRPTTNVRRGSEQYRALVADEPTLRSIVERLGGEVIVVWKSRAYRFY